MLCGRHVNGWETFGVAIFPASGWIHRTKTAFTSIYLRERAGGASLSAGLDGRPQAGCGFNSAGVLAAECGNGGVNSRERLRAAR